MSVIERIETASFGSKPEFDPLEIKRDFPIFRNNPGLVFLDTAASAQKPQSVVDAVSQFYERDYANVHRGVYSLSQRATDLYEAGRQRVRRFLNARHASEIVFVRGATEGINLVAQSFGLGLKAGDEIVLTELEHHSNIVPWQMLRDRIGVVLVVAPMDATGRPRHGGVRGAARARAPGSSRSRISRTGSAPCCRSRRSSPRRTPSAPRC